jgi:SAM-dependent methyltransferase
VAVTAGNEEQAIFWSELGPTWLDLEDRLEEVSGLPGRLAMDRLDPRPGQRIVDLGCGAGRTTVELAARVAPGGSVLGIDIADEMLAGARRRTQGVPGLELRRGDVQVDPFEEGPFDGAYSRFGVMFFADPPAAFANVRRALRPNGTLSFVCWQGPLDNEWMSVPVIAAAEVIGPPPLPEPGAPGPFALADPDRVGEVLASAGFGEIDIEPHTDDVVRPESDIAELAAFSTRVGMLRRQLRDAPADTRRQVVAAVEEALRGRVTNGQLHTKRAVLLVRAQP